MDDSERIINLLLHVKEQNNQILAWINSEKQAHTSTNLSHTQDELPFNVPIANYEELNEVENSLIDKNIFNLLVSTAY